MNLIQARRKVQEDQHLQDILTELRRELPKTPKPTIGELSALHAKRTIEDLVIRGRLNHETTPNLYETDFQSYFTVLWIIIIDDYEELCLNEYIRLGDPELDNYLSEYKSKCRQEYLSYLETLK